MAASPLAAAGQANIPKEKVLSDNAYLAVVAREKLNIAPVAAGFLPSVVQAGDGDSLPDLNALQYQESRAILQEYVALIARLGPRKDIVPRVTLVLDERPNAFAVSSEQISITTGLVSQIANSIKENKDAGFELIFLLAHEYGHILFDHPRRYAKKIQPVGFEHFFGSALQVAVTINRFTGAAGAGAVVNKDVLSGIGGAISLSPYLEAELHRYVYGPYVKDAESLADFVAVDLFDRLNEFDKKKNPDKFIAVDPRVASAFLSQMEKYDNSVVGQLQQGAKRLGKDLEQSMNAFAKTVPDTIMQSGPEAVWQNAQNSLAKGAGKWILDTISKRFSKEEVHIYYSAEKRVKAINAYADKFYPLKVKAVNNSTLESFGSKIRSTADLITEDNNISSFGKFADVYTSDFAPDKAANEARLLLASRDIVGARAVLDAVIKQIGAKAAAMPASVPGKPAARQGKGKKSVKAAVAPTKVAPETTIKSSSFHMANAQTYIFEGKPAAAETAYKLAIAQPGVPYSAYIDLATVQDQLGRPAEAERSLDKGAQIFGENKFVIARISHYKGLQKNDKVLELIGKCAEIKELKAQCDAMKPDDKEKAAAGLVKS